MSIDIHLTHEEVEIEVDTLGADLQDKSYVLRFGEYPNKIKLFVSHKQLREITGMAINEMIANHPDENSFRGGSIEATYTVTDEGKSAIEAALVENAEVL